jgi:sugar O-acyltransferase (sialic acid O-acetyltransferase NeuD family)
MKIAKEIILVAAGGHGRSVLDSLLAAGKIVHGIVDPNLLLGSNIFAIPVLGGDEVLEKISGKDYLLANGIGANPSVLHRADLYCNLLDKSFQFVTVIHPSATVSRESNLGDGCQIMAGAIIQSRVEIGCNAVVNTGAILDHDVVIGAHTFIAPGAVLCGEVAIGIGAFIGAGAILLPGIKVGDHAIVAAGALVRHDVLDGEIHAGIPARKMIRA